MEKNTNTKIDKHKDKHKHKHKDKDKKERKSNGRSLYKLTTKQLHQYIDDALQPTHPKAKHKHDNQTSDRIVCYETKGNNVIDK